MQNINVVSLGNIQYFITMEYSVFFHNIISSILSQWNIQLYCIYVGWSVIRCCYYIGIPHTTLAKFISLEVQCLQAYQEIP